MTDITPERIAKIAEWMGLRPVGISRGILYIEGIYNENLDDFEEIPFDPINNPADAWRVLEHVTAAGLRYVEMCTEEVDIHNNTTGEILASAHGANQREALCAAVLEMIDAD